MSDKHYTIHKLMRQSSLPSGKREKVINEATGTTDINVQNTRPELVSLTRAVNNLIYHELVAVQETELPVATLFGVRYRNPNGDMTFSSAATYSGRISGRTDIDDIDLAKAYVKGDLFKHDGTDVVYEVIEPITLNTLDTDKDTAIMKAVFQSKIRLVSEAADTSKYETSEDIASTSFQMDRWNIPVRSRKFKTEMTVELMQDLEANQFEADGVIEDILGTVASEEVNKDIIQTLITVSKRYNVDGLVTDGIFDGTTAYTAKDAPALGRILYQLACEMGQEMNRTTSFDATYVLATARVVGILAASGWMHETDEQHPLATGKLNNGYYVYTDTNSPFDYMLTGCKYDLGDMDHVGSLFFAPYTEADEAGSIKVSVDPASLQPKVAILMRYGLSVNPYTAESESDHLIKGDDWSALAGKSKLSQIVGIKLPKLG
ncbi:capsid vertex protein [Citrobacter phage Margaery]|uniref:Capsid vertex protein n=2 Tax=Pseudotevenvirus margaery TaxID=2843955 RepID=A0A0M4RCA2_9CAUD|nr:capsid vertex protein [Citrobacter phage Margaery]ALF01910.1 capsid vertex protein [Citrobacter phage Margaery]AYJ73080.1 major capsid protein [Citrobacter phage Maroon]